MEQKNIKIPVFTNETVFTDSAEQAIDVDFTLPDYCPDILKILKCRAISRISSKGVNGRNITVDGTVTITVIYSDSNNCLNSYEYQYPFSKSFESDVDTDGACLSARTKCEYINCRAVTGRKVDIHGAAGIYIKLTKRRCDEVISDVDDKNIELLRGVAPATVPMGSADKYLIIEEEIELGGGQPDIRSLIRYDTSVAANECKLMQSKAVVKGELVVTLLYCPQNGSAQTVRSTLPFSQLIEIEGVNDACSCEATATVAYLEIKPRVNATGEARSFMLNAKILVCCECYCNNDIDVILDAYSRKYEADIVKSDICFNKIVRNINDNFNCKKSIEFPEGALCAVSDLWCDARTDSVKFEDGNLCISGVVSAYIIANDSDNVPIFYEKPIDFTYKCGLGNDSDNLFSEPKIDITTANYTITGGNMELRVDLCINAAIYDCKKMPLIVDVRVNEKQTAVHGKKCAMTIYFANKGESVWDIARRYFADVNEVKQINDITDDMLTADSVILVPMN